MPGTKRIVVSLCGTAALALPVANAHAQVHGPGPSDPALFDTVINLPADQATISGSVGNELGDATPTTQLNVTDGGTVYSRFTAYAGSEVNISGGVVGSSFEAQAGSEVNVSGGRLIGNIGVNPGSSVQLSGDYFSLNGAPYSDPDTDVYSVNNTFSGVLADGSPFIFVNNDAEEWDGVVLNTVELPVIDTTPIFVNGDSADIYGVSPGQTLTLQPGGALSDFVSVGATLNLEGGSVVGLRAVNSEINIKASDFLGTASLSVYGQSTVNIDGGGTRSILYAGQASVVNVNHTDFALGSTYFIAENEAVFNIRGGFARAISARTNGVINISGGKFLNANVRGVSSSGNGILNISGGDFSSTYFEIGVNGQLNLLGTAFFLDGVSLQDHLSLDQAFILTDRGGALLTGTLADGSAIEIVLNTSPGIWGDSITSYSTLTLNLVSELAGDYNSDGFISQADLDLVLLNWGETVLPFEFNQAGLVGGPFDGLVSQNELDQVLLNWGDGAAPNLDAIPEPTTAGLLGVVGWATLARRRRGRR